MHSTKTQPKFTRHDSADTRSAAQDRCPVCDVELDIRTLPATVLQSYRGRRPWVRCPKCHSFFVVESYDTDSELGHLRTNITGKLETGLAFTEAKAPMFDAILRRLRGFAPRGGSLLDVGCSYGSFLERARKEGYQVRGVDIVPEVVEYVRGHGFTCDCAASVADLDIPEGSQDVISVLDCSYYWPNHRRELRAIRARLRPGGLLVMRVADVSWAIPIALGIGRVFPTTGRRLFERAVYDHRASVPIRSLLRVIGEEGFRTLHTSVRDAVPIRHHNLKARLAYAVGDVCWRVAGFNVAPGLVILARKEQS